MTEQAEKTRVAVNGYGVIGKRVADAVAAQRDMLLVGVADVETDWRVRTALQKGYKLFAGANDRIERMLEAGLEVAGTLDDLLEDVEIVVDCTPKGVPEKNADRYRAKDVKFILQGGEKHELTGHSFVAEATCRSALGRGPRASCPATRPRSCAR